MKCTVRFDACPASAIPVRPHFVPTHILPADGITKVSLGTFCQGNTIYSSPLVCKATCSINTGYSSYYSYDEIGSGGGSFGALSTSGDPTNSLPDVGKALRYLFRFHLMNYLEEGGTVKAGLTGSRARGARGTRALAF